MTDLSVFLVRDHLSMEDASPPGMTHVSIVGDDGELGRLFVKKHKSKTPRWATFFAAHTNPDALGHVEAAGALYLTPAGGRLFAVSFGTGRFLLQPDTVEERFGLMCVLNASQMDDLRSVDTKTFSSTSRNKRVQVARPAEPQEFGIDASADLIRTITANPTGENLPARMTGADHLGISIAGTPESLSAELERCLKLYQSDAYKKYFGFIDKIKVVKPKSAEHEALDGLLAKELKRTYDAGGVGGKCWMAIPDIVDWDRVVRFRFGATKRHKRYTDLHLPGFFATVRKDQELHRAFLQQHFAFAVDGEDSPIHQWSIMKCLHYEVEHEGQQYLLSSGSWYRLASDFIQEVRDYVKGITPFSEELMEYSHETETAYNKALAESNPDRFVLLDAKNIAIGGRSNKIEFCDIYTREKQIIHIKRFGTSQALGHLCNQAMVSGTLLRSEKSYAGKVNEKMGPDRKATHHLPEEGAMPRAVGDYSIVFAIVSGSETPIAESLPFFTQVALRSVCERLRDIGYADIRLGRIAVNPEHLKKEENPVQ
ncbi:uncharacterized protein (TIGR04141 family) [Tahibacter aquaticus]|uniref:Uncharacterized protein (TIGR04141 family) n=1 Tax=Tahibacter aquaticus TaxID=520092 RepID=A0A4R6YPB1_9GAMM|nr:DUF6119 family protein [Tahibacter aquaticus]TDR39628.1 uncharacterized protein (TIGR04141 family) [Tahibacter aquaticus]